MAFTSEVWVPQAKDGYPAHYEVTRDCPVCFGDGQSGEAMDIIDGTGCWRCGGNGTVTEDVFDDEEDGE